MDATRGVKQRICPQLLRRLLNAETLAHDLPAKGIHVASSIDTADGGEVGCITWTVGPDRTPFRPSRLCQFQFNSNSRSRPERPFQSAILA